MRRITLNITETEAAALLDLAREERRDPREQAAMLLRGALVAAGRLPADDPQDLLNQAQTAEPGKAESHEG